MLYKTNSLGVFVALLCVSPLFVSVGCDKVASNGNSESAQLVKLDILDLPAIKKQIAAHKDKKVAVVDFWSTSCPPCMKEFPGLVALAEKHPDVACVSVSIDFEGGKGKKPEDVSEKVLGFLKDQKAAKVQNILSGTESDAVLADAELDLGGSIPVVIVYAKDGSVVKKFTEAEPFTYADVEKTVAETLNAK
jgi:thiol-disulfide isomerase/thioredoxin